MELTQAKPQTLVTLADDPAFRGYIIGRLDQRGNGNGAKHQAGAAEDVQILVAISAAGGTGLRGNKPFSLSRLQVVEAAAGAASGRAKGKQRSAASEDEDTGEDE